MRPPRPTPCSECPWRRVAPAGWLGPLSSHEWVALAHSDAPIACHATIIDDDTETEAMTQCAGAAIFRSNVCKSPRDRAVKTLPRDTERVFARDAEFLDHHGAVEARLRARAR